MRGSIRLAVAAVAVFGAAQLSAQDDGSVKIKDGGVKVSGWMGKIDAREATAGLTLTDQRFVTIPNGFQATTGPATTYWSSKDNLKGDFTVMATFYEAKYMALNSHPHPYGLVVAGKNLDSDKPEALYCAAYGNGTFILRGFSATAPRGTFQMNGPRGGPNDAINKAAGKDQPVKQDIAISIKGDNVSCSINGTVVATHTKAELIGDGKLTSLDGYVGLRFAHNTDATVTNWMVMK